MVYETVHENYQWSASIIHLTDLHLFTDRNGESRAADIRSRTAAMRSAGRALRRFPGGSLLDLDEKLAMHSDDAFKALQRDLPVLGAELNRDGRPLVVLQTGDFSAYGTLDPSAGVEAFPEMVALHRLVRDRMPANTKWIDLFGNHDIWPGFPPPVGFRNRVALDAIEAVLPEPMPRRVDVDGAQVRLEFYPVNTVNPHRVAGGGLARGGLCLHPRPAGGIADVLDQLEMAWAGGGADGPIVRVLLVHHPIHAFDARGQRHLTAMLVGSDALAEFVARAEIHLVIAGHRHRLDPVRGQGDRLMRELIGVGDQPPLPKLSAQLVAQSATQDSPLESDEMSFSVYRLLIGGGTSRSLRVVRRVYRFERFANAGGSPIEGHRSVRPQSSFVAGREQVVIPDLPC